MIFFNLFLFNLSFNYYFLDLWLLLHNLHNFFFYDLISFLFLIVSNHSLVSSINLSFFKFQIILYYLLNFNLNFLNLNLNLLTFLFFLSDRIYLNLFLLHLFTILNFLLNCFTYFFYFLF